MRCEAKKFFMIKLVVKLVEDAIAQISTFDWRRACEHTAKIEEEYIKKNDGIPPRQPPVQVNVNDTTTSSESESSSSSSDYD